MFDFSVDELQMVCTRLVALLNGTMKVDEPMKDINTNYADGYTLLARVQAPGLLSDAMLKTMEDRVKALKKYIKGQIPGAALRGQHIPTGLVIYKIKPARTSFADIFASMEESKQTYHVTDYTLSDLSLEQVFLKGFVQPSKSPKKAKVKREKSEDDGNGKGDSSRKNNGSVKANDTDDDKLQYDHLEQATDKNDDSNTGRNSHDQLKDSKRQSSHVYEDIADVTGLPDKSNAGMDLDTTYL